MKYSSLHCKSPFAVVSARALSIFVLLVTLCLQNELMAQVQRSEVLEALLKKEAIEILGVSIQPEAIVSEDLSSITVLGLDGLLTRIRLVDSVPAHLESDLDQIRKLQALGLPALAIEVIKRDTNQQVVFYQWKSQPLIFNLSSYFGLQARDINDPPFQAAILLFQRISKSIIAKDLKPEDFLWNGLDWYLSHNNTQLTEPLNKLNSTLPSYWLLTLGTRNLDLIRNLIRLEIASYSSPDRDCEPHLSPQLY